MATSSRYCLYCNQELSEFIMPEQISSSPTAFWLRFSGWSKTQHREFTFCTHSGLMSMVFWACITLHRTQAQLSAAASVNALQPWSVIGLLLCLQSLACPSVSNCSELPQILFINKKHLAKWVLVCASLCMFVCERERLHGSVCINVCAHVVYTHLTVHLYFFVSAFVHVCLFVCLYLFSHVCWCGCVFCIQPLFCLNFRIFLKAFNWKF